VLRRISFGGVAVLYATTNRARNRMGLLAEINPSAREIGLYMEKIFTFLETVPAIVSGGIAVVPDVPREIELRNVSFGYGKKDSLF